MLEFKNTLKARVIELEEKIESMLIYPDSDLNKLTEAMFYSLKLGGKRIRPILMLEFYRLCGGRGKGIYNFAIALEMIHTYSLIHDDLPCMDNDDFRRGKPSCHKAFDEATAVLAGDALLTEAFNVAAAAEDIEASLKVSAIKILAEYAGVNGMIGGQILDIQNEDKAISKVQLLKLYSMKTGALIKTAVKIGCLLANSQDKLPFAEKYAENIGLAFQIVDDILDVTGDEALIGKPINSDQKNNKTTFVNFFGLEESRKIVSELTNEAKNNIDKISPNGEFLKNLADYLTSREN